MKHSTLASAAVAAALALAPAAAAAQSPPRAFALELGLRAGLAYSTAGLDLGPDLGLEVGGRLRLGPGALAVALRGSYARYSVDRTGALDCAAVGGAPSAPCVSPAPGNYSYTLTWDAVTIGLPITYRFLSPARAFTPYAGVAPELVLARSEATAYGLANTETATRFAASFLLGAQLRLGPGAAFFEAAYRLAPVAHRATGDANLSVLHFALGYRLAL